MTKQEKWKILREMPILNDDNWYTLVGILDQMIEETDVVELPVLPESY